MVVSIGKENEQKSRNTSLAADENQYIYSYLFISYLPKQRWIMVASYFPDEIADYFFD